MCGKGLRALAGLTFIYLSTLGCASQEVISACKNADWYEIGREDGSLGFTSGAFDRHRRECKNQADPSFEDVYMNGRDRGLIEFCTPENAFALGKSGQLYYYVCPFQVEQEFISQYRRGQKVLALEKDNLQLDQRMEALFNRMRSPASLDQKFGTASELTNLKQLRAKNEAEISKLQTR
jgi:hypothetical protein